MDLIRNAVQPITHNLPKPIRDVGVSLLGSQCYRRLIHNVDLSDRECISLALSKGLGVGIVGTSAIVKLPQLLSLIQTRDTGGLSFLSFALETTAHLVTLAYSARSGFPFNTYGESAFIALQNLLIAALVLHFSGRSAQAAAYVAAIAFGAYGLFASDLVTPRLLTQLQAASGPIAVLSKLPQIWTIWNQGGVGQLSAFTVFNYLAGSIARVFTTMREVKDPLLLYNYFAGFVLNAILALQMLYYWKGSPKTKRA